LLGAGAGLIGLGLLGWLCRRRFIVRSAGLLLAGASLVVLAVLWFAYLAPFEAQPLPALGPGERPVAFVLAFEDDTPPGERRKGHLRPGAANRQLADWVRDNATSFSLILTQETVLWSIWEPSADYAPGLPLAEDGKALRGVPVYRMHAHKPDVSVPTLEGLICALARFEASPSAIVLVAHEKHYQRAAADLRALYAGPIYGPCVTEVAYRNDERLGPLRWAARELLGARPRDFVRRNFARPSCDPRVVLPRIEGR